MNIKTLIAMTGGDLPKALLMHRAMNQGGASGHASGALATFETTKSARIKSLKVAIEPVQDLHGYNNPWPAGGGKNLLEWTNPTTTINGVMFTVNSDGSVLVNGTATGGDSSFYSSTNASGFFVMKAGDYIISGCPAEGSNATYFLNEVIKGKSDVGNGVNLKLDEDTNIRIRIVIRNGYTANNLLFKPMIRLSSVTDSTFAPYSNICPISGWTGVKVYRSGANTSNPTEYTVTLPSDPGTVYGGTLDVVSGVLTVDRAMVTFDGSSDESWTRNTVSAYDGYRFVITDVLPGAKLPSSGRKQVDFNLGHYELGNVVGTIFYTKNNNDKPVLYYYPPTNLTEVADFKAWLGTNNMQVLYELATPLTYNLTPTQIKTLVGTNNIWSDAGDVDVTYLT